MIKDLIKYVVDMFPTSDSYKIIDSGPCEPTEIEPTVESTITSRKEQMMIRVKQDVAQVTEDVVRKTVRDELFKKYGMDEQKELDEYFSRTARLYGGSDNSFMEARLVTAIVNEMTNEVMGDIRRREMRDEIQGEDKG
jgi:hypothetical protein